MGNNETITAALGAVESASQEPCMTARLRDLRRIGRHLKIDLRGITVSRLWDHVEVWDPRRSGGAAITIPGTCLGDRVTAEEAKAEYIERVIRQHLAA